MEQKMIAQIRLDLERLKQDFAKIDEMFKNVNKGKSVFDIPVTSSGIEKVTREVQKSNSANQEYVNTITKVVNGLKTIEKYSSATGITTFTKEVSNAATKFDRAFNLIMNKYNTLDLQQRQMPVNIRTTINALKEQIKQYQLEGKEVSRLVAAKTRLEALEQRAIKSTMTSRAQYANQGFEALLQQRRLQQISDEKFIEKASRYMAPGAMGLLTNQNQVALMNELTAADQRRTRAINEQNSILARNRQLNDMKPINQAIAAYRHLTTEEQKRPYNIQKIITQYDKLIERYKLEGREIAKLLQQRNVLKGQYTSSLNSSQKEAEAILKQYGVNQQQGMFARNNTLGSGDARATFTDKFTNSLIYSTSAMAIGAGYMGVRNAIKSNVEYEKSLTDLSRTLGNVTKNDLANYGKQAIQFSKEFGQPLNEVQKAMTELARAGIDNRDDLSAMTKSVLLGLNTTEIKDANEMVGYLVSTVKQLGLEFKDSESIIDKWNYLADKYAVKANDFAEATSKAGSASKFLGVDLDTLNSMVVVLGEATQKSGSEIGNALKTLENRITRPETIKTLESLGVYVRKDAEHLNSFQNIMEQANKKLDEFGEGTAKANELLDAMGGSWRKNDIAVLSSGWGQIEKLNNESLTKAPGWSAQENVKIMQTLDAQFSVLKASATEFALALGKAGLFEQIRKGVNIITDLLNAFNNLNPGVKQFAILLGEVYILLNITNRLAKSTFGFELAQTIFSLAMRMKTLTLSVEGLTAAHQYLKATRQSEMINSRELGQIYAALRTNTTAMGLSTRAATVQQNALNTAMNATIVSSRGVRAAIGAATLGITIAITFLIEALMSANDAIKESNEKAKEQGEQFKNQSITIDDLRKRYIENKFSIQDNDTAKKNLINTEKELKDAFGKSAEGIDLQNASLTKNLELLDKVSVENAKEYLRQNEQKGKAAKDSLENSKKSTYTIGSNLDDVARKPLYDILQKYGNLRGTQNSLMYRKTELDIEGTLETKKNVIGNLLDDLNKKYRELDASFKGNSYEAQEIKRAIDLLTPTYANLKTEIDDLNAIVEPYNNALNKLKESEGSQKFTKQFANELQELDNAMKGIINTSNKSGKAVENMSKLMGLPIPESNKSSENDIIKKMEKIAEIKQKIIDASKASGNYEANKQYIESLFKTIEGTDKLGNANDRLKLINSKVEESTTNLTNASKDLASVYKEQAENGNISLDTLNSMLEKYPELAKHVTIENGLIKINGKYVKELWELKKQEHINSLNMKKEAVNSEYQALLKKLGFYKAEGDALIKLAQLEQEKQRTSIQNMKNTQNTWKDLFSIPGIEGSAAGIVDVFSKSYGFDDKINAAEIKIADINKMLSLRNDLENVKNTIDVYSGIGFEGITSSKPKKEKSGGSTAAGVNESEALIESDRYFKLNSILEKTNTLIERNKALQENSTAKERINLLNAEILLLQQKQNNLHDIAEENRQERSELVGKLKKQGFGIAGEGDSLEVLNGAERLKQKQLEVNSHASDKDKSTYNALKKEYDEMEKNLKRFIEIQVKSIPGLQQDWLGLSKNIKEADGSIEDLKVTALFEPIDKVKKAFDSALDSLKYEEQLAGEDIAAKAKVTSKIIETTKDKVLRLTKELNYLNQITDQSILVDQKYIDQKEDLRKALEDTTLSLKAYTDEQNKSKISAIEDTEKRIIDIIEKGVELRKKTLDKELNDYKEFVDEQLKKKDELYATEDYEKSYKKEEKARSDIQKKINAISFDSSIEAYQKRKELEKELSEQNEKITDLRTKRSRELEKQNLQNSLTAKEKANKKANEDLEVAFSDTNKKIMAHDILINKSFDTIKSKLPEVFKELEIETGGFFKTFETYEVKFGNMIGDIAKKFRDEILPNINLAVSGINTAYNNVVNTKNQIFGIDWREVLNPGSTTKSSSMWDLMFGGTKKSSTSDYYGLSNPANVGAQSTISSIISNAVNSINTSNSLSQNQTKYSNEEIAEIKKDKARMKIKELQLKYYQAKTDSERNAISSEASKLRAQAGLSYENLLNFKSIYPQSVLDSFSQGINNGLVTKTGNYLLHGTSGNPEWVLTNTQMLNFVKNMSTGIPKSTGSSFGMKDFVFNLNIAGNADSNTVNELKTASKNIMLEMKKELNKLGVYK